MDILHSPPKKTCTKWPQNDTDMFKAKGIHKFVRIPKAQIFIHFLLHDEQDDPSLKTLKFFISQWGQTKK